MATRIPSPLKLLDGDPVDADMEVHGIGLASFDNDFIEPDMSIGSAVLSGYFCGNRAEMLDRVLSVFIVGDEVIQIVR